MPGHSFPHYRLKNVTGGDGYALIAGKRAGVKHGTYDPGSPNPTSTLAGRFAEAEATTAQVARSTSQSSTHTLSVRFSHAAIPEDHLGGLRSISNAN